MKYQERVRPGRLKKISEASAARLARPLAVQYLSGVVSGSRGIQKGRALLLESLAAEALGLDIPASLWMFGPASELKAALSAKIVEKVSA